MKVRLLLAVAPMLWTSCSSNQFPNPYAGFEHPEPEQGYWREVGAGEKSIGELHLHSEGISVTMVPFETYKDYWGIYSLSEDRGTMRILIEGGNDLPGFKESSGRFVEKGTDEIQIEGIALDNRRPGKTEFRFQRFEPRRPD